MPKSLILTDGKAGHQNQSMAFARAIGTEGELFEIHFKSKFHKALSYVLGRLPLRTSPKWLYDRWPNAVRGQYAAVIGTGSGTFFAVSEFAREIGAKSGAVLYPRGYPLSRFDCILAPKFDRPRSVANVIALPANLVSGDSAFYDAGVKSFRERHTPTGKKVVAVIVGGPNKCSTMSADWMRAELDAVFARNPGCEFWVTTSRRTPPAVEEAVDKYAWDYRLLYSRDHYNPIPAFVKLADLTYVTAESTGMLSEACTFGTAEVRVLDNLTGGRHKFRRFVEDLERDGYVNGNRKVDLTDIFKHAKERMRT